MILKIKCIENTFEEKKNIYQKSKCFFFNKKALIITLNQWDILAGFVICESQYDFITVYNAKSIIWIRF